MKVDWKRPSGSFLFDNGGLNHDRGLGTTDLFIENSGSVHVDMCVWAYINSYQNKKDVELSLMECISK